MHHQGTPRIAVAVEAGEAAVVEMVINAAESGDPDGPPGSGNVVRLHHIHPQGTSRPNPVCRNHTRPPSW